MGAAVDNSNIVYTCFTFGAESVAILMGGVGITTTINWDGRRQQHASTSFPSCDIGDQLFSKTLRKKRSKGLSDTSHVLSQHLPLRSFFASMTKPYVDLCGYARLFSLCKVPSASDIKRAKRGNAEIEMIFQKPKDTKTKQGGGKLF